MRRKWLIFALIVRLRLVGGVIFNRKSTGGVGVTIFKGVFAIAFGVFEFTGKKNVKSSGLVITSH